VDTSGTIPFETIAEKAKKKGMRVGIISSVSIDHATPAAFYAHQPSRGMYFEIGYDLTKSDVDFFGGGGLKAPLGVVDGDSVDLIVLAKENGFNYVNNKQEFRAMIPSEDKVLFINPELTGGASMYYAIDQPEDYVTLAEITQKAINYLDNEKGFFMMVEGGKIDWLCHSNDAGAMVREVLDFSAAVEEAINFYKLHPDETLIVVTADHETGGLGLGNTDFKYESDYALLENQKISGENFNVILSDWRKENHLNEKGFKMMLSVVEEYFGLGGEGSPVPLQDRELKEIRQAFMAYDVSQEGDYGRYSPLTLRCTETLAHYSGPGWTTMSHTGIAVPVYALGVNSNLFSGNLDNTDVPKLMWNTVE
jgi:alkaline phosphatase